MMNFGVGRDQVNQMHTPEASMQDGQTHNALFGGNRISV